ncbi:MAG: restriction endonuclease [Chloroflexi bacterium]|nr:restriction endonuclease [Chloroflexota bacterium]
MMMDEFEAIFDKKRINYLVFLVLKDQQWHCREHEYTHTRSTQIAGGAGIQGLQRGTQTRPGMVIESANHFCVQCKKQTRHDRWQGGFVSSVQGKSMPPAFARRVFAILGNRDIVENVERTRHELTIDHKLPMLRWTDEEAMRQTDYAAMTDDDIRANFQLLKKSNGSISHNLLKSRACERCYQSGQRGQPFGIDFYYAGTRRWAPVDKNDPSGCEGCGWYDFAKWRDALNDKTR